MNKEWIIKPEADEQIINDLSESLSVSKIISNLLVQRGIKNFDDAKQFFRPELSQLHDPFLIKDMGMAVGRLEIAIKNNEKILVYGDYDVDGTTAVATVYSFFKKIHPNIDYYIPDRYNEGYGISTKGIDYAVENNFSLIIALDCGIKAVEKIDYANDKNIDFIICDHHTPGDMLPEAVAVLDPKRNDCEYPFKELSGCGVGFKLIQAFAKNNRISDKEVFSYLDLVAVSIASDIVPIIGENRVLAFYGLKKLNHEPQIGLKSLIKISGLEKKEISITDVVFKIGPRINAAGRIDTGAKAVELLIADDIKKANNISNDINDDNNTRKDLDKTITQNALKMIEENEELKNKKTTVLYNSKWHKGVIGIVASRLIETYYRPTIVLTLSNGLITGSARSVQGFNLYNAIEACKDLLENFGGHKFAAGLSLKPENLKAFQNKFEQVVSKQIEPNQLIPKINIDAKIKFEDINNKLYRILKQFQPLGPGNMSPVFSTENVYDNGNGKKVGKNNEHLKLSLFEKGNRNKLIQGIAFRQANCINLIQKKQLFNVCYTIEENNYNGNTSLQIKVKDIKKNC
ncbi:MAG: single-stranded-DNA-specific exonuclease RecJ [Bacteroidetes bacterium]|nr:single-stranded-DNA-specific exonuclease RecJ [Bacteroidota bacterium]